MMIMCPISISRTYLFHIAGQTCHIVFVLLTEYCIEASAYGIYHRSHEPSSHE